MDKLDLSGLLPRKKEGWDSKSSFAHYWQEGFNSAIDGCKLRLQAAISSGKIAVDPPGKLYLIGLIKPFLAGIAVDPLLTDITEDIAEAIIQRIKNV